LGGMGVPPVIRIFYSLFDGLDTHPAFLHNF